MSAPTTIERPDMADSPSWIVPRKAAIGAQFSGQREWLQWPPISRQPKQVARSNSGGLRHEGSIHQ
jgi:hypothetical protein